MAVYGIGAYYFGDYNVDVTKDFFAQNCVCIGYEKEDASTLYEMFRRIKVGDIIYIKSFSTNSSEGKSGKIFIKGIAIVTGWTIKEFKFKGKKDMLGYGREVIWKKKFNEREDWIEVELEKEERKNNVYSNTLYEEYSTRIINLISKVI